MPSPTNPAEHPTDAELLGYVTPAGGAAVARAHLRTCVVCRTRVAAAGDEVTQPTVTDHGLPAVEIPGAAKAALQSYDYDAPIQPGALWRLEWFGHVVLAYVHSVDEERETAQVMPVAEDVAYADAATLIVDGEDSPLGFPLTVWVALERVVPQLVFDRPLGTLAVVTADVGAVRTSLRTGKASVPTVGRIGAPIDNDLDPRITYRHAISAPLDALAGVLDLLKDHEATATQQVHPTLSQLLIGAEIAPTQLAEALGWERHQTQALYRDQRPVSPSEAAAIAAMLGTDPAEVTAAAPAIPPALLAKVHAPPMRRSASRWAEAHEMTEVEARWQATASVMTAKKRTPAGRGGEPDWDRLLDDFFAE